MGFAFTLLFTVLTHLSIEHVLPFVAHYRPMVVLAILGALVTVMAIPSAMRVLQSPAVLLFLAFYGFMPVSRMLRGWFGGAHLALLDFLPAAMLFFLVLINVNTANRARVLMICLLACGFYTSLRGIVDLQLGIDQSEFIKDQRIILDLNTWDTETVRRIRGLGFLADPNDFAQFLLIVIPVLSYFYKERAVLTNLVLVYLPGFYLLLCIFNTRSRGGALGFLAIVFVYLRDRANATVSFAMTSIAVLFGLGIQFGAGRAISVSGGTDRLDIWSDGIGMFKTSPIWGVGYDAFTEHSRLTAHNSYLLVATEMGIVGLFLWLGMIVFSLVWLSRLNRLRKEGKLDPEWARLIPILRFAYIGYLVTSYFLSRAYSFDIYILFALTIAASVHAVPEPEPEQPDSASTGPVSLTPVQPAPAFQPAPALQPEPALQPAPASRIRLGRILPANRPALAVLEQAPPQEGPALNAPAPHPAMASYFPEAVRTPLPELTLRKWFVYTATSTAGSLLSIYIAIRMRSF